MNWIVVYTVITVTTLAAAQPEVPHAVGETRESQVAHEVQERFDQLVAAARALDTDLYMNFFDRDRFTGLNHDGKVIHSLAEFEQEYRLQTSAIAKYISLDFQKVKIAPLSSEVAVLVNEYQATVELSSGATVEAAGGGSQVWSKASGDWLLVSVSSSVQLE